VTHVARHTRIATLLGAVILATCTSGHAEEAKPQTLFIGGVQGSSAGTYTYAGHIAPLQGARVGQGWFYKNVASWLTYNYNTDIGGAPVQARAGAAGFETGLGYAWEHQQLTGDVSLLVGVRNTRLWPLALRAEGDHGTHATLTPQVAARYQFSSRWNADVLASYSMGPQSSFSRGRLNWHPGDKTWRIGVEVSLSEGEDYRTKQTGLFAGRPLGSGWFVEMNAGQAQSKDGNNTPYVGVSFSLVR
jgi:hypothetical protein